MREQAARSQFPIMLSRSKRGNAAEDLVKVSRKLRLVDNASDVEVSCSRVEGQSTPLPNTNPSRAEVESAEDDLVDSSTFHFSPGRVRVGQWGTLAFDP